MLSGVIYTHGITDEHVSREEMSSFRIFTALCGDEAADRVRLVTTKWDESNSRSATDEENNMKTGPWGSLLNVGARYNRFDNTTESAWRIVLELGETKKCLLVQREVVDMEIEWYYSTVGIRLQQEVCARMF